MDLTLCTKYEVTRRTEVHTLYQARCRASLKIVGRYLFAGCPLNKLNTPWKENFLDADLLGLPKKVQSLFDLMLIESNCINTMCFYIFCILILQLKVWYKIIKNSLKVCQAVANQKLNFKTNS